MGLDRTLEGRRVRLIFTTDPHTHRLPGDEGTVNFLDDAGTLHVRWDDGGNLGLIEGHDMWKVLCAAHGDPCEGDHHRTVCESCGGRCPEQLDRTKRAVCSECS